MFIPPRGPNNDCSHHAQPSPNVFVRRGTYRPTCRPRPVPRVSSKCCGRSFSRQTFRADYRDHKPHLNYRVIELLCSGIGYRQAARLLGLTRKSLEAKARKISRNALQLDLNLKARGPVTWPQGNPPWKQELHFDEFETYETRRNTRPLSVAVMIETKSRFLVAAIAAPSRPRGKMTRQRIAAIEAENELFGPRQDRSRLACRSVFRRAARLRSRAQEIVLRTDEKSSYPGFAREAFAGRRVTHLRTPSVMPRTEANPLFPINHTEALLRDLMGRLRRESWLVSKLRTYLNLHLALHAAYRNWVRPRFNRDSESPGQLAGFARRRLRVSELCGWRQDWGSRSICPLGEGYGRVRPAA